jgi:MFS superfamily sulfate permease-like transporter
LTIDWLPNNKKSWLTPDLLAGLSVWALVIPQALGYADMRICSHWTTARIGDG